MNAKEEYVDAPRETRSKDITVYAVIFLILLVGAGISSQSSCCINPQIQHLQPANPESFMTRLPLRAVGIIFRRRKLRSV